MSTNYNHVFIDPARGRRPAILGNILACLLVGLIFYVLTLIKTPTPPTYSICGPIPLGCVQTNSFTQENANCILSQEHVMYCGTYSVQKN